MREVESEFDDKKKEMMQCSLIFESNMEKKRESYNKLQSELDTCNKVFFVAVFSLLE